MTPLQRKFRGGWGGGLIGRTIRGGDMDIFWNHTFYEKNGGSFSENYY